MKKLLLTLFCVLQINLIFAANAKYDSENYNLSLEYNDVITPGDAIFVRMNITVPKTHKKNKNEPEKKATLQLLQDKKILESAPFYQLKSKKTNITEMLCGVPVSLWLKEGNYSIKVIYADNDTDIKEFILPSRLVMRTFPEEVLELDERNTNIKTDNSPERAAQI